MMSSGEYSIVEEEYLVYAELCDNTDPTIFNHAESNFKSFAFDSDQPILTIGGQAFVGTYKDTVGTAVFLEEAPQSVEQIGIGSEPLDPLFVHIPAKTLSYVGHTRKTLEMSRVLLIDKNKHPGQCKETEERKELTEPIPLKFNENGDVVSEENEMDEDTKLDFARQLAVGEAIGLINEPMKECSVNEILTFPGTSITSDSEERKVLHNIEKMQITTDVDS